MEEEEEEAVVVVVAVVVAVVALGWGVDGAAENRGGRENRRESLSPACFPSRDGSQPEPPAAAAWLALCRGKEPLRALAPFPFSVSLTGEAPPCSALRATHGASQGRATGADDVRVGEEADPISSGVSALRRCIKAIVRFIFQAHCH